MGSTIGRIDYEITQMAKDDKLPFHPIVHLCLKSYGGTTKDGSPTLSPHLMTEGEIDEYVNALKDDLDAVAKKAKRALVAAKKRTLEIVEERKK